MSQSFRHPEILEIARNDGKVMVEDLSNKFGVSHQTIRRDLSDLAEAGKLERVHGGAVLPSGTSNIQYEERRLLNADRKTAIAKACATQIPDEISVFLGIGSSTEAVARALAAHKNLMVVTNNINVANILADKADCDVILTGGRIRRSDGGLIGHLAAETVQHFKLDLAIIGCSALDQDGDMLDFDLAEISVNQTVLRQSRRSFLVADHSKFRRSAPARMASLAQIDTFFTDAALDDRLADQCTEWKTAVTVVQSEKF